MNPHDIDTNLTNRGLLPTGTAGSLATAFIAAADVPTADRYRGALLGSASGDALGRPVESMAPDRIKARHGKIREFMPWRGWNGGPVGTFTDDTQLTLWTARAILDAGDDHPAAFARTLVERLDAIRGMGRATRQAVIRHRDGKDWWTAGVPSAGNGVAMRVAPLGLAFGHDLTTLRREAARNAVVTHADRLAVASGIVQAYAVARLTRTAPGTLDRQAFLAELVDVLAGFDDAGAIERRPDAGPEPVRLADRIAELGDMLDLSPSQAFARTYNGAFVLESLPAAIWAFLANADDPEEAIVVAVNGGYDADTVAAMTGAMAGAYHGETGLPDRWLDDLEAAGDIRAIAGRLHREATADGSTAPSGTRTAVDADRVHVSVLLDRSGSMSSIADDTIGGFNTFVAQQRELPGDARITLVQFDGQDPQDVVASAVPVAEFTDLDDRIYQPRGNTPLLDALGTLIERIDRRAAKDSDEFQLVAVITDGHENASERFTRDHIADMVKARSDAGWAFVFLGANIDSFGEARTMGMRRGQAADWEHTADGVRDSFAMLGESSTAVRGAAGRQAKHAIKDRLMDDVRADRQRKNRR
ncbi:MAG: ADP-ribosylglycohydrolase [Candidatus Aldehydirespiratoraceae bacterium]